VNIPATVTYNEELKTNYLMFKPNTITSRYCSILTCKRFVSLSQFLLEYFVWHV